MLTAGAINNGEPVAWICQSTVPPASGGTQTWTESWVYLQELYVEPSSTKLHQAYKFQYVVAGLTTTQVNAMSANAASFGAWLRTNPTFPQAANAVLLCDTHQVTRTVSQPPS